MSSFHIPVSALRRQQQRLELLGSNIANINTTGYKSSRMTFVETLGTVTGVSKTLFKQGALEFTGNVTDLAIQGKGFFVVRNGEEQLFTRAGAFTIDSKGKLVNSSGFALQGWAGSIGSLVGGAIDEASPLGDIIIDNNLVIPAKASENLWLTGNLNAGLESLTEVWSSGSQFKKADGTIADGTTKLNDLLQTTTPLAIDDTFTISGTDSDGNVVSGTYTYADGDDLNALLIAIDGVFTGNATAELKDGKIVLTDDKVGDSKTTISIEADAGNQGEISIPGFVNTVEGYTGRITTSAVVYDSLGKGHSLTMDFEKTENSGEWIWNLRCSGDEEILSGGTGKAIFDSDGNLVSFTYDGGVNKLSIDPKSGAGQMDIVIHGKASEGYSGISQFDSVSTLLSRDQDGRKSGTLKDFYVDTEGSVIGLFTNGENLKLAQVALAQFNNSGGLMKANGSNYIATAESGSPKIDAANNLGATIESGSLEVSTVDMADQFTRMIEAQRSYQAAARVITTFDQILEETTRLKR
jgi:flagellar hook protein FlgE